MGEEPDEGIQSAVISKKMDDLKHDQADKDSESLRCSQSLEDIVEKEADQSDVEDAEREILELVYREGEYMKNIEIHSLISRTIRYCEILLERRSACRARATWWTLCQKTPLCKRSAVAIWVATTRS